MWNQRPIPRRGRSSLFIRQRAQQEAITTKPEELKQAKQFSSKHTPSQWDDHPSDEERPQHE